MGLFGKNFDEKAAALSFFSPEAGAAYNKRKDKREERERDEAQRIAWRNAAKAKFGFTDQELDFFEANPNALAAAMADRMKIQQFGAAGGSTFDPRNQQWNMAPSRHEYQGSVFDVGPATPGQAAAVTPQHQGTQWVTPQPGTRAFGVNSFTGERRGPPSSAPKIGDPPRPNYSSPTPVGTIEDGMMFKGGDDTDPANWVPAPQGGAGSRGPRHFPGFPY